MPLVSVSGAVETAKPRIIQIPEPPKAEPKRHVQQPQKPPERVKPAPSQAPATPSLRAPVHTKPNRKIWI